LLSEDEHADDLPVFPQREGDEGSGTPGVANRAEGGFRLRIEEDRFLELLHKGRRGEEEGSLFR